jgi:hypothetical protein
MGFLKVLFHHIQSYLKTHLRRKKYMSYKGLEVGIQEDPDMSQWMYIVLEGQQKVRKMYKIRCVKVEANYECG